MSCSFLYIMGCQMQKQLLNTVNQSSPYICLKCNILIVVIVFMRYLTRSEINMMLTVIKSNMDSVGLMDVWVSLWYCVDFIVCKLRCRLTGFVQCGHTSLTPLSGYSLNTSSVFTPLNPLQFCPCFSLTC